MTFNQQEPPTDKQVVDSIKLVAESYGLTIGRRQSAGSFCTVSLETDPGLSRQDMRKICDAARIQLQADGVRAETTHYNNPPYKNARGKMEEGHPRHGQPYVEIESVWWDEG